MERLVEQINSDLTSAQQQNAELSPKTPVESTINQLLASKPKTSTDNPRGAAAQSNQRAETVATAADPSGRAAAAIVSDEESLKILLSKPVKQSPVTDLDVPTMPDNPNQSQADHKNSSHLKATTDNSITQNSYTSPEHDESACGAVTGNDITVNDVLDQVGEAVDETILLSIDEEKSHNTYKSEKPAPTLSNKKGLWIYLRYFQGVRRKQPEIVFGDSFITFAYSCLSPWAEGLGGCYWLSFTSHLVAGPPNQHLLIALSMSCQENIVIGTRV